MSEVEETLATGAIPVPARLTIGALPEVLLFTVRAPVRLPRAVGAKAMLIEHVAPAARLLPQLFVSLKSPVTLKPEIWRASVPVFERLTFCAALKVPTCCGI